MRLTDIDRMTHWVVGKAPTVTPFRMPNAEMIPLLIIYEHKEHIEPIGDEE